MAKFQTWECRTAARCVGLCPIEDAQTSGDPESPEVAAELHAHNCGCGMRVHVMHEEHGRAVVSTFNVKKVVSFEVSKS